MVSQPWAFRTARPEAEGICPSDAQFALMSPGPGNFTVGSCSPRISSWMKTIVLEARPVLGGASVTEEFHRGFKASTVAHTLGPLRSSLVEALDLTT